MKHQIICAIIIGNWPCWPLPYCRVCVGVGVVAMLTRPLPRCRQNLQRRVAQPQSTNRSLPCCKQKEIFKWPKYNCRHSERDGGGRKTSLSPSLPLCGCVTLTTRRPCRACPRNCRSPAARQCADASACDILWLRVSDLKMAAISLVLLECVTLLGPPLPSPSV